MKHFRIVVIIFAFILILYASVICSFITKYDVRTFNGICYFYGFKKTITDEAKIPSYTPWGRKISVLSRVCTQGDGPQTLIIPDSIICINTNCTSDATGFSLMKNLKVLKIGAGLEKGLSGGMLADCLNLEKVIVEEGNKEYYVSDNCIISKSTHSLIIGFGGGSVAIPDEVQYISSLAFYQNRNISCIHISSNVVHVESAAFSHCENLTEVWIDNGVLKIDSKAFQYCSDNICFYISGDTIPNNWDDNWNDCCTNIIFGLR